MKEKLTKTPKEITDLTIEIDGIIFEKVAENKIVDGDLLRNVVPGKKGTMQQKGLYLFHNRETNEIPYIGIALSEKGFNARYYGHWRAAAKLLDKNDNYRVLQETFKDCDMYVHIPEKIDYCGVEIDPTKSIESTLIAKYQPTANTAA